MRKDAHRNSSIAEEQDVSMCKRKAMAKLGFLELTKWQSGVEPEIWSFVHFKNWSKILIA